MKKQVFVSCCAVAVLFSLFLVGGNPLAQEKQDAPKADAPARPRAQPRGRLPNYYRQVVTPEQREKIYAIQAKYVKEIDALEKQIADLEAKRDAEVEALLSDEQKAKLKTLTEEARKRREAAAAERAKAAAAKEKEAGATDK